MQRDRPNLHPAPRAEVAGNVIDHLLRLQIGMVVRDRHRQWIEVQLPRAETADHEVPPLERLVRRRRLVNSPRDRLEVVHRERPRVEEAVPPHDVERVVVEDVRLVPTADAYLDGELTLLAVRVQLRRRVDVAVVIRRALEHLSVLVAVAARDLNLPGRLEDEVALLTLGAEAIRRPARDDDVVALLVRHVAEGRLERARALVDEDDLVPLTVPEEVVHLLLGPAKGDFDVVVPHQHAPAADLVPLGVDAVRLEVPVRMRVGNPLVALDLVEVADLHHPAGRLEVVEDRLHPDEALHAHDLFREELAIVPELDVALARHLAEALIERHG